MVLSIAYDRQGGGPPVILVGGALDDGSENAPLATELAERFTVYNYARRGRGESGDTAPYAVQRELEDIAALIAVAGGSAHLFGVSSGGMFALEAAAAGLQIERLAVYKVPYDPSDNAPQRYREYRQRARHRPRQWSSWRCRSSFHAARGFFRGRDRDGEEDT